MSKMKLNDLIIAFRKDLEAMENGTYVAPLPHPNRILADDIDQQIDSVQKVAA
jgi:hypothetical protein